MTEKKVGKIRGSSVMHSRSENNNQHRRGMKRTGSGMEDSRSYNTWYSQSQTNDNTTIRPSLSRQLRGQQLEQLPDAVAVMATETNALVRELDDDTTRLRGTCNNCAIGKIKCDRHQPCERCTRRGLQCIYSEKKKCGPKPRRSTGRKPRCLHRSDDDEGGHDGDPVSAWLFSDGQRAKRRANSGVERLTSREQRFLSKYYTSVNKFIPLTCLTVIRDAMNPLQLNVLGVATSEAERNIYNARKAVLLGCVAIGAIFCGEQVLASMYLSRAQMHLKTCYDALLPEVVSGYLVLVVYHIHFSHQSKAHRYLGFAQQMLRELAQSHLIKRGYMQDSVRILSTILHVSGNNDVRVEDIDLSAKKGSNEGDGSLSRVIALFSQVLLQLYWSSQPEIAAKSSPLKLLLTTSTLEEMVGEADILLSTIEDPGSLAILTIKVLKGYFLLARGKEGDVLDAVAKPVMQALEEDHGVLNFPLCWTMCQSVITFSRRKGWNDIAERMERYAVPQRPTFEHASDHSSVLVEIFSVYARGGVSNYPSLASAGFVSTFPAANAVAVAADEESTPSTRSPSSSWSSVADEAIFHHHELDISDPSGRAQLPLDPTSLAATDGSRGPGAARSCSCAGILGGLAAPAATGAAAACACLPCTLQSHDQSRSDTAFESMAKRMRMGNLDAADDSTLERGESLGTTAADRNSRQDDRESDRTSSSSNATGTSASRSTDTRGADVMARLAKEVADAGDRGVMLRDHDNDFFFSEMESHARRPNSIGVGSSGLEGDGGVATLLDLGEEGSHAFFQLDALTDMQVAAIVEATAGVVAGDSVAYRWHEPLNMV